MGTRRRECVIDQPCGIFVAEIQLAAPSGGDHGQAGKHCLGDWKAEAFGEAMDLSRFHGKPNRLSTQQAIADAVGERITLALELVETDSGLAMRLGHRERLWRRTSS